MLNALGDRNDSIVKDTDSNYIPVSIESTQWIRTEISLFMGSKVSPE